jgi:hypothetical protein
MFVAATLYSDTGSCPIHVRNMSLQGALIEGAVLPELDTPVTLRRGSLQATATIVWKAGRKAGIVFGATVHIADWMSRNPECHQARVDELVRGIRSGTSPSQQDLGAPLSASLNALLESELRALRLELLTLENGLTGDVIVVATHPEIQLLDVALQRVERLLKSANCC